MAQVESELDAHTICELGAEGVHGQQRRWTGSNVLFFGRPTYDPQNTKRLRLK